MDARSARCSPSYMPIDIAYRQRQTQSWGEPPCTNKQTNKQMEPTAVPGDRRKHRQPEWDSLPADGRPRPPNLRWRYSGRRWAFRRTLCRRGLRSRNHASRGAVPPRTAWTMTTTNQCRDGRRLDVQPAATMRR